MRIWDWLKNEKNIVIILCAAGVMAFLGIIAAIVVDGLHNGEKLLPSVPAAVIRDTITADDGTVHAYSDKIGSETGSGDVDKEETEAVKFRVNINTASVRELMLIPGIGEKRANAIVEYRTMNGGFRSVAELAEVDGIGEKIYEQICGYCTLEGESVQYE